MSDETFAAFVARCRDELVAKNDRFTQRIAQRVAGAVQWSFELADRSLTIGEKRFHVTPIGTHSQPRESWLWAWANEEFPPDVRTSAASVRALYTATGFRVFDQPGIGASRADAIDLIALAVHQLDAIAMFVVPSPAPDGPTLYLAVYESKDG